MGQKLTRQMSLFSVTARHDIGKELGVFCEIFDATPEMLDLVYKDLIRNRRQETGRPGMTAEQVLRAEKLLKAQSLMILYSIRSNRQLVEQIHYNFLFRWFLGMALDEKIWDHSSFSKNNQRLIGSEVAAVFLSRILEQAKRKHLLSSEHFTVDGTLIEAWASVKSFKPKDGPPSAGGGKNDDVNFKGKKLANETHGSDTDPAARLYRKGKTKEAKLCYLGHTLMENRSGLIVKTTTTQATGTGEREAAKAMVQQLPRITRRITLGGDKGYDTKDFVRELRELKVTPHVA